MCGRRDTQGWVVNEQKRGWRFWWLNGELERERRASKWGVGERERGWQISKEVGGWVEFGR